jgi:hypothetical protein
VEIFEQGKTEQNTSRWVPLGAHELTASGAPGKRRLPGWEGAGLTDVITLQREDEMNAQIPQVCQQRGWRWHHIPLSGKKLEAPTDPASLLALAELAREISASAEPVRRIVVHCSAGLHRTGVALYVMLRAVDHSKEEALALIEQARALTAHELDRTDRHGVRLLDTAEAFVQANLSDNANA